MRLGIEYEGITERIGGWLNLVPVPIGLAMFGMPAARAVQVAQRTGLLAELARGPASADRLAAKAGLRPAGTKLLLDTLCAAGLLHLRSGERYVLRRRWRKWLSPDSSRYVGDFLADTWHYWEWWGELDELVLSGRAVEIHHKPPEDPYWRSYITGQYQLARLSSDAVARVIPLRDGARSLLDVAGAHGEFSMALCRRHPGLEATIVDLPGSVAVGREIVARAGMADRVGHREGDMFETDLGARHDGALCFNIIHHLTPERGRALLGRIAAALSPGATVCVLDMFARPAGRTPDSGAFLGLFFHLTSGADTYPVDEVGRWLTSTGFHGVSVKRLPQLPGLALLMATRSG